MMGYIITSLGAVILALGAWVQALRLDVSRLETGKAKVEAAAKTAERDHAVLISERQSRHAANQQAKEDTYAKTKERLARERDADRAVAAGLRDKLAAATADTGGAVDPAASQRERDRHATLGKLAGEGVELVVEARSLLNQRDADVQNLLNQIRADRLACSPGE